MLYICFLCAKIHKSATCETRMNDHSLHRDHNVTELRGEELFPTMKEVEKDARPGVVQR